MPVFVDSLFLEVDANSSLSLVCVKWLCCIFLIHAVASLYCVHAIRHLLLPAPYIMPYISLLVAIPKVPLIEIKDLQVA